MNCLKQFNAALKAVAFCQDLLHSTIGLINDKIISSKSFKIIA